MTKNDHQERSVEKTVRDIRRATRRNYSAEEKCMSSNQFGQMAA
ncbi:hypothetical protein C8R28_10708 [Nitrosomonas ureae]|uniref:Uncharacterized protein n=1 Tax=Nitrosomonas ureae TaxID=44577 RepID=A0A2T5I1V7_9PROT|nr:hypothetical protein C8R28_10708 [Nitrosomonas ureae]